MKLIIFLLFPIILNAQLVYEYESSRKIIKYLGTSKVKIEPIDYISGEITINSNILIITIKPEGREEQRIDIDKYNSTGEPTTFTLEGRRCTLYRSILTLNYKEKNIIYYLKPSA